MSEPTEGSIPAFSCASPTAKTARSSTAPSPISPNARRRKSPPSNSPSSTSTTWSPSPAAFGYNRDGKRGKKEIVIGLLCEANQYLIEHPRGKVATTLKTIQTQITKLKLSSWVSVAEVEGLRKVGLHVDEPERAEESKLDGCYLLKTDLTTSQAAKETAHSRYKDLALVVQAQCDAGNQVRFVPQQNSMNPLERSLIENAGYANGWENVRESTPERVVMFSPRHKLIIDVTVLKFSIRKICAVNNAFRVAERRDG